MKKVKSVHLQNNNVKALSDLVKMGRTNSVKFNKILKEIWEYLIVNWIVLLKNISQAFKTFRQIDSYTIHSLFHLMRAIARAHASTLATNIYCLKNWNEENERKIKKINLNS